MGATTVINGELLASLVSGRDLKVLLDETRILFAYLNQEHADLERSVFGLDGTLRRSVPGYVKPSSRTVELRVCAAFGMERVRGLLRRLQEVPALRFLDGYQIRYGSHDLGPFCAAGGAGPRAAGALPEAPPDEERPSHRVWDLDGDGSGA